MTLEVILFLYSGRSWCCGAKGTSSSGMNEITIPDDQQQTPQVLPNHAPQLWLSSLMQN